MCNHAYIFCANNAANVLALSYVRKARRLALYLEQQESIGQEVTEEALVTWSTGIDSREVIAHAFSRWSDLLDRALFLWVWTLLWNLSPRAHLLMPDFWLLSSDENVSPLEVYLYYEGTLTKRSEIETSPRTRWSIWKSLVVCLSGVSSTRIRSQLHRWPVLVCVDADCSEENFICTRLPRSTTPTHSADLRVQNSRKQWSLQ